MNPKAGFIISRLDQMSDQQRKSLDLLYQPILLPRAYALVNLLWRLGEIKHNSLIQEPVANLLTLLSISGRAFERARDRLEGTGLLKLLVHRDAEQIIYVYQLIPPLTAAQFYRDDLLSVGLLEAVGTKQYQLLNRNLVLKPHHFGKGFRDVTKNFLDVFTVDHNKLTHLPKVVAKLRRARPHYSVPRDAEDGRFNFRFLLQILDHSFVNITEVERHRGLILTENALYGVGELRMANFIKKAASVSSNRVNFTRLKILIAQAYQGRQRFPVSVHHPKSTRAADHANSGLAAEEKGLVKAAKSYAPVEFLNRLRDQMRSNEITTHKEIRIIHNVMDYNAFQDNRGVINVMIYYAVVDRQMTSLNSGFMDTMVNSWTAANVNTPAEALLEISKFKHSKQKRWRQYTQRKYHRRGNYRQRPVRESLPKWARSHSKAKLHRTSPSLQHEIKERLKRLGEG